MKTGWRQLSLTWKSDRMRKRQKDCWKWRKIQEPEEKKESIARIRETLLYPVRQRQCASDVKKIRKKADEIESNLIL